MRISHGGSSYQEIDTVCANDCAGEVGRDGDGLIEDEVTRDVDRKQLGHCCRRVTGDNAQQRGGLVSWVDVEVQVLLARLYDLN